MPPSFSVSMKAFFLVASCTSYFHVQKHFQLNIFQAKYTAFYDILMYCKYQKLLKLFCTKRPRSHLITYPVNSTRGNSRVTYKNSFNFKGQKADFLKCNFLYAVSPTDLVTPSSSRNVFLILIFLKEISCKLYVVDLLVKHGV